MLRLDKVKKIERAHYRDGRSIKGISREMSVSRTTVRKVLRSGAAAFSYKRRTQPRPKIGPWQSELDGILLENSARRKRDRLTFMQIFKDLRSRGYEGGYDAVRRYAARWRKDRDLG